MLTSIFTGLNPWAVLVAGLAAFTLGGIWYQVLFGKKWVALHRYSREKCQEMQRMRPPYIFFGGMILCYLVLALAVALVVNISGAKSFQDGALLGFLLWLGPAAAIGMTGHIASDKKI